MIISCLLSSLQAFTLKASLSRDQKTPNQPAVSYCPSMRSANSTRKGPEHWMKQLGFGNNIIPYSSELTAQDCALKLLMSFITAHTEVPGWNSLTGFRQKFRVEICSSEFVHTAVIKEKKRSNHHTALTASALIALLVQRGKERVQTNILVYSQTAVQLLLHTSLFPSPLLFHPPSGKGLFVRPASHTKVGINTRHCWKTKLIL